MASMSSVTPPFSMVVSSSFTSSSNVNPYWKPEQPPPCTNTRSFSWSLPSSSISSLTLAAALSVKISGAGMSVTAFMCLPLDVPCILPRSPLRQGPGCEPSRRPPCSAGLSRYPCPAPILTRASSERKTLPGPPGRRPHDHHRRTVLHPPARRPRGGRHQGRDAGRRHDADPATDPRRLQPPLRPTQCRQAQRRARPEATRRRGSPAPARRAGRPARRELPPRRHGQARARLRLARRDQSPARLLRHLG